MRRIQDALLRLITAGLDPGLRPVLASNLRSRPGRSALTVLAVCLGVAVMLGVQVDSAAVAAQASAAAGLRFGQSGLDVLAPAAAGLSAPQLAALQTIPGVEAVAPLHQKRVIAQADSPGSSPTTVTLVGVRDGEAALRPIVVSAGRLPSSTSDDEVAIDAGLRTGLAGAGSTLGVGGHVLLTTSTGPASFRVVGLTAAGSIGASFTDDAVFVPDRELVGAFSLGLDTSLAALRLSPGTTAAEVAAQVHARLGGSVTTFDPATATADPLSQIAPLLLLISALSVVIGAGVTANTVSLGALERRREIGLLRAAGVPARQVFRLLCAEALILAVGGALLGVGAGIALGAGLQAAFGASSSPPVPLQISPLAAVLAALAGIAAAALAAAVPAEAAARTTILDALSPESAGRRERVHAATLGAVPALLVLTVLADLSGPVMAVVGVAALLLAVALALPLVAPPLTGLLARSLRRLWPEGEVAAAGLRRRRNRTALTLSGLVMAVAAAVACSILVAGSLAAGDAWVDSLFLGNTLIRSPVTQRASIASQISEEAGVQVTPLRFFPAVVDQDVVGVTAVDSAVQEDGGALVVVSGSRAQAFASLRAGPAVLAPQSLASADDWSVGSRLAVAAPAGTVTFTVAGIVQHSFPAPDGRESLLVDATQAQRFFGTDASGFDDLEVLTPGRATQVATTAVRYGLDATPTATIREAVSSALGETIGILPAISWIALGIAMLAVVNTLVVNVRNGRRELALLRAVGLSSRQARRFVLTQAGFLGATAGLLGAAVGCLLALPMLAASQSPGYAPAFDLPWPTVLALAAATLAGTVISSLVPARRAARSDIVSALIRE